MIGRAVARVLRLVAGRPAALTLAAEPESALMATAAALRRLGARITRYDGESGTLEATHGAGVVRVAVTPAGADRSRLRLESGRGTARGLRRRLRAELARPSEDGAAKGDRPR